MPRQSLRYDKIVEAQLRGVVRAVLEEVAENGVPGSHSLYITFRTGAPGVDIPDYMVAEYPEDMTIVLEHQYRDLIVEHEQFAVTLSFNKVWRTLSVPFSAIASFSDPSVQFGLKFEMPGDGSAGDAADRTTAANPEARPEDGTVDAAADDAEAEAEAEPVSQVVSLDAFRKK